MFYRGKSKSVYKRKAEKKPIRLAFGLVEENSSEEKPIVYSAPPAFEKYEIVGTLTLKKTNFTTIKNINEKHVQRVKTNLKKIYDEGNRNNSTTIIDAIDENILTISFNFNQTIIDRIKGLDRNERLWDPENRLWHIFIGCFDDIFDILGRGFKLTDTAYNHIINFISTKYYAAIAMGKLGKIILRESWFDEFDFVQDELENSSAYIEQTGKKIEKKMTQNQLESLANIKRQVASFPFKRKPYSHQIVGIEFLMLNHCCALLDEMGCGKSFQIALATSMLLKNKSIDKCLIVAPKSLVHMWRHEIELATDLPYVIVEGSPNQREKLLKKDSPIFIIHYEGVRLEKEPLAQWLQNSNGLIVFDESQRIKNINSQTTISAKYVRNNAKRCIIATGTPIANRPLDIFSQYFIMDNGATFGTNFNSFKNTFCYIEYSEISQGRRRIKIEKFLGVRNEEELQRRINLTSLRRLKNDVLDLPPIIFKDYTVELKAEQKSIYTKVRDNIRNELENMSEAEYQQKANHVIVKLLRLSQIASNPQIIDPKYKGSNVKFDELDEILTDILSDECKKVILWSHFVGNVNSLFERYSETWGAVAHTGEMATANRTQSVAAFQDNPECRLFIATPQSAKEGLTLLPKDGKMKADTMIYLDLNFDAGSYMQSQARFHRIGQNVDKCLVIHLIATHTVDEYIKKSIIDKIKTAAKVLDNQTDEDVKYLETESPLLTRDNLIDALK